MDPLTSTAASGVRSRLESLELLANNLANAGTTGFKADREFYGVYVGAEAAAQESPASSPVIEQAWTDFTQGTLQATGNPLDLAIDGGGMFSIQGPDGPLYTRNGSLHLAPAGALVTADGNPVLDVNGRPIRLDSARPFDVDQSGAIKQGGDDVATLALVSFAPGTTLTKVGKAYFQPTDPAVKPERAVGGTVYQGKVETSNVGTAEASMRLVEILRQFEMLEKAISIGGDMNRRAVEDVAKVTS